MSDDYLWDRSGEPDPEVQRLERILGSLRYERPAPLLVERPRRSRYRFLAAAAAALVVAGGWLALKLTQGGPEPGAWDVSRIEGEPRVGSDAIGETGRLPVGEWLVTDSSSRARIAVPELGRVDVGPESRIRLLASRPTAHRLELTQGELHARINAPPRLFFVETPSAVAVDLGCEYTLEVAPSGLGLLRVTFGWVSFERDGRESLVPVSGLCLTRPGVGPGTPYSLDASEALQIALAKFDFEKGGSEAIATVLAESDVRDTLTLWHLLGRVDAATRARVFDRLVELAPPTAEIRVDRAGVLGLDKSMLERWRAHLRLSIWGGLGVPEKPSWTQTWRKAWDYLSAR